MSPVNEQMIAILFSILIFLSRVYCSSQFDLATKFDRLLAYHRFEEVEIFLASHPGILETLCTSQVVSRCMDLCNYSPHGRYSSKIEATLNKPKIDLIASEFIRTEAKKLLDLLLPFASKVTLTRALNVALFHGHDDLINQILAGKDLIDFEADEEGVSPLMMTIKFRRFESFKWLLAHGADVHYINFKGENVVHVFAKQPYHGSNFRDFFFNSSGLTDRDFILPNIYGRTPLDLAKRFENQSVIDLLSKYN